MPFIGNQPALSYTSFAKQDFTTSATTSYTLDNPVTNENELALFINFVRQEPTTAYTASGTSLTLTSATSASDDMYCVFLGKAVQTVNPPNGSVGTAQIADLAVTSGKLASGVLPTNTPAFLAYANTATSMTHASSVKITFDNEIYDTDSAFASSRFTVPTGKDGKYFFYASLRQGGAVANRWIIYLRKNGGDIGEMEVSGGVSGAMTAVVSTTINLAVADYVEVFGYQDTGSTQNNTTGHSTQFLGFKIIE